jgi:hypothetical protein
VVVIADDREATELQVVQAELDGLANTRGSRSFTDPELDRYEALCERERQLLAARPDANV